MSKYVPRVRVHPCFPGLVRADAVPGSSRITAVVSSLCSTPHAALSSPPDQFLPRRLNRFYRRPDHLPLRSMPAAGYPGFFHLLEPMEGRASVPCFSNVVVSIRDKQAKKTPVRQVAHRSQVGTKLDVIVDLLFSTRPSENAQQPGPDQQQRCRFRDNRVTYVGTIRNVLVRMTRNEVPDASREAVELELSARSKA
jgi:hypothetical protein